MFERFTDRARRVVVLAQEETRILNHNYIGTEHILYRWLYSYLHVLDCVRRLDRPQANLRPLVHANDLAFGDGADRGPAPLCPRPPIGARSSALG
jgi:hypothetical protein